MTVFQYVKYKHTMIILCLGLMNFAKQLHSEARADYLLWKASGKPRAGVLYFNMCQSRIRFKRTLRECRQNEEITRANEHDKSFMDKDMTLFWKGIKKNNNSRVPLAPMIDKMYWREGYL